MITMSKCYCKWDLTIDLGDGDVVELCARYSGVSREVFQICDYCCFGREEDDTVLEYGKHTNHYEVTLAEGVEWK
jgi:hypothetical protein